MTLYNFSWLVPKAKIKMKTEQEIRKELEDHQDQALTVRFNALGNRDSLNYIRGYINALKYVLEEK